MGMTEFYVEKLFKLKSIALIKQHSGRAHLKFQPDSSVRMRGFILYQVSGFPFSWK